MENELSFGSILSNFYNRNSAEFYGKMNDFNLTVITHSIVFLNILYWKIAVENFVFKIYFYKNFTHIFSFML